LPPALQIPVSHTMRVYHRWPWFAIINPNINH
jgi:hypothetical protein